MSIYNDLNGNDEYVCPVCKKHFKASYYSKTILSDWQHNSQLASSNYKRHKQKCLTALSKGHKN